MAENENTVAVQEERPGFYSKKFKEAALKQLNGRWTTPVLVTLVCSIISYILVLIILPWEYYIEIFTAAFNGVDPDISSFPFLRYFIGLFATFLITPVITMANMSIYPMLYKSKEPVKFSEFISGFSLWGKAMGAFWWQYLWLLLWGLAGMFAGFVVGLIPAGIAYGVTSESGLFAVILPITGYIAFFVVILIKAYQYCLTEWAIVDNNNLSPVQALSVSKKLTKGYKWNLFCLDFSFIGWNILVSCFPIGDLWLSPYKMTAKFNAYRYLLDSFNSKMDALKASEPKPVAIEDEPVSAEVDTSDGNQI